MLVPTAVSSRVPSGCIPGELGVIELDRIRTSGIAQREASRKSSREGHHRGLQHAVCALADRVGSDCRFSYADGKTGEIGRGVSLL